MALTDRSSVKLVLGIPAGITMRDSLIDLSVNAANDIVLGHLGLPQRAVTSYSEKFDVDEVGQRELSLTYRPVVSVAALTIGGTLQTTSNYYVTEYGALRLIPDGSYFPTGRQHVEITYTAGFSSVPDDVKTAATMIAAQIVNEGGHSGYRSERMGGYSYTLGDGQYSMIVRRILSKYTRVFARS